MAVAELLFKAEPLSDSSTLAQVIQYLRQQHDGIEKAFILTLKNPLPEFHVEPTKLRDGLTVLADGTNWNPGSGQGVYTYYAGAWHKLG